MSRPAPDAPVVALDIDGTAGDYHAHFISFAASWLGRELPSATAYTGGVPFNKYLGVSRQTYLKIKLAYRQGGMKRSMPVYDGIGDFTKYIRNKGVQLWICTTRPYLNLSNIDPDTRHWLRDRAHIQYDGILYGQHKYRDLVKVCGAQRVVMVYDDLPALIEQALGLGVPACLRTQPYNAEWAPTGSAIHFRAGSVEEMVAVFDTALEVWRDHGG